MPYLVEYEAFGVGENSAIGTLVGITAYAEDLDAFDSVSYTLSDDAGGLFAIDSETRCCYLSRSVRL